MSLALLFHYLLFSMFQMLVHPSSGACDLFVLHGLYCSGLMCVGVMVWFGWGGVVSLCRLKHCFNYTQHVSNVSTSIFRSLRLIVDLFRVLYCSGSMCVGVTLWFGWGGVVSLCRLKHCFSLHKDVLTFETC